MLRVYGDQQKSPSKVHASKPEAQAEGIRVCCTKNPIPSARASGFLDFGFTQRNIKKRKLRETTFLIPPPNSLGSRLGLLGVQFRSAHHQNFRRGIPCGELSRRRRGELQ
jgi:hypothetical protein